MRSVGLITYVKQSVFSSPFREKVKTGLCVSSLFDYDVLFFFLGTFSSVDKVTGLVAVPVCLPSRPPLISTIKHFRYKFTFNKLASKERQSDGMKTERWN